MNNTPKASDAPMQFTLIIDYVPGQGWEAAFDGGAPTLNTGGFGWAAGNPAGLLRNVTPALAQFHRTPWEVFSTSHGTAAIAALTWYVAYMRQNAADFQAGYDAIKGDPEARAKQDQSMVTTMGVFHAGRVASEAADQADAALAAYRQLTETALPAFDLRHGHVLDNALMVHAEHLRDDGDETAADTASAARDAYEALTDDGEDDEPLDAGVQA